jgi:hypothetical protein
MAPNIALLCLKRLVYAFLVEILGSLFCLMLMLKLKTVLPLDASQQEMPSAVVLIYLLEVRSA